MLKKRPDAQRRLRQSFRFRRLIRLLMKLQGSGSRRIADLAGDLECSERTVFRDLQVLELAGVPWVFDRTSAGYRLQYGWEFPALHLTPDEVVGQALATIVTEAEGLNVGFGARATSEKLAGTLPPESQKLLVDVEQLMTVLNLQVANQGQNAELIRTVQWALLNRKQVAGLYVSPYDSKPKRLRLHPYRVCLVRHAWYLIGRPIKEGEPKTYRLGRFKSVRALDEQALVPQEFSLLEYLGNAWSVFRGDKTYDIELHFSQEAAVQVTETRWHATQQARWRRDGSVTLTFQVDGLDEIVWWLLGWSGFVKIIKPPELITAYKSQLAAGLKLNP